MIYVWLALLCIPLWGSDIVMVTLALGHQYRQIVAAGTESKRIYADRHGYDIIIQEQFLDRGRPPPWNKIPLLLKVMENRDCKWVFWLDADSMIMNLDVRLEDFLDDEHDFILTKDLISLNTGHFFLRNTSWSRAFLEAVYRHKEFLFNSPWEQAGVIVELEQHPEWGNKVKFLPQRTINAYPKEVYALHGKEDLEGLYQEGDFILHFAGIRANEHLKELFLKYAS